MNNDSENFVPEIDPSINLPCDTPPVVPPAASSLSIDDVAASMSIDDATLAQVKQLLPPGTTTVSDDLLKALVLAVRHDEDVSNAEAQGYVRGRNENIEAQCGFDHPHGDDDVCVDEVNFPRYARRSVWD